MPGGAKLALLDGALQRETEKSSSIDNITTTPVSRRPARFDLPVIISLLGAMMEHSRQELVSRATTPPLDTLTPLRTSPVASLSPSAT